MSASVYKLLWHFISNAISCPGTFEYVVHSPIQWMVVCKPPLQTSTFTVYSHDLVQTWPVERYSGTLPHLGTMVGSGQSVSGHSCFHPSFFPYQSTQEPGHRPPFQADLGTRCEPCNSTARLWSPSSNELGLCGQGCPGLCPGPWSKNIHGLLVAIWFIIISRVHIFVIFIFFCHIFWINVP